MRAARAPRKFAHFTKPPVLASAIVLKEVISADSAVQTGPTDTVIDVSFTSCTLPTGRTGTAVCVDGNSRDVAVRVDTCTTVPTWCRTAFVKVVSTTDAFETSWTDTFVIRQQN